MKLLIFAICIFLANYIVTILMYKSQYNKKAFNLEL